MNSICKQWPSSAQRCFVWYALMKPMRISSATFCKIFTSPFGRSFAGFSSQCSLRTWVYRVAHNAAISGRIRRRRRPLASLEEIAEMPAPGDVELETSNVRALDRLRSLIRGLKPPDDQVMLLYLEDADATTIGEITGLSARAVVTRIHRIKSLLAKQFRERPIS